MNGNGNGIRKNERQNLSTSHQNGMYIYCLKIRFFIVYININID